MLHAAMSARSGLANQIILFIFALTIYDEFDDNAMVTDRIITSNYTFVSATLYYSDIGMIEVDAYINTRRAQWTQYKLSTAAK